MGYGLNLQDFVMTRVGPLSTWSLDVTISIFCQSDLERNTTIVNVARKSLC